MNTDFLANSIFLTEVIITLEKFKRSKQKNHRKGVEGTEKSFRAPSRSAQPALRAGFFHFLRFTLRKNGAPTPVRTGNPQFRRLMLYPVELWVLQIEMFRPISPNWLHLNWFAVITAFRLKSARMFNLDGGVEDPILFLK